MEKINEEDCRCVICQEIFNNPHSLICNHTYCYDCITNYIQNFSSPGSKLM